MRSIVRTAMVVMLLGACRGSTFQAGEGASSSSANGGGPSGGSPQGGSSSGGAASGGAPSGGGGEGAGGTDPCATCVAGDNATASCDDGTCTYTCDAGFGDCDSEPSDCEVDIKVDGQCGACGVVCGYGDCIELDSAFVCNDPIDIEAGDDFNCALKRDGAVWCWGLDVGPLPTALDLPLDFVVERLSLGVDYGCVQSTAGGLGCWSAGDAQVLELQGPADVVAIALGSVGLAATGPQLDAQNFSFTGSAFVSLSPEITGGARSFDITTSSLPSRCVVDLGGVLRCRGRNTYGQIGPSAPNEVVAYAVLTIDPVLHVGLGDTHVCVLTEAGGVHCRGRNTTGVLGPDAFNDAAVSSFQQIVPSGVDRLVVGPHHNAVFVGDTLYMFGENSDAQIAPDGQDTQTPVPVQPQSTLSDVALGAFHSCALADTGRVQCWGRGTSGQLGDGSTVSSSTPVDVAF